MDTGHLWVFFLMFKTKAHTGPTRGSNVTGIHTVTRPVHTTLLVQLLFHTR